MDIYKRYSYAIVPSNMVCGNTIQQFINMTQKFTQTKKMYDTSDFEKTSKINKPLRCDEINTKMNQNTTQRPKHTNVIPNQYVIKTTC